MKDEELPASLPAGDCDTRPSSGQLVKAARVLVLLCLAIPFSLDAAGTRQPDRKTSSDEVALALRAIDLFAEPLRLNGVHVAVEIEPFPFGCKPYGLTVRGFEGDDRREVFRALFTIVRSRIEFFSMQHHRVVAAKHLTAAARQAQVDRTLRFLESVNGWRVDDRTERPAFKEGFVERRMRDPQPLYGVSDTRFISFESNSGLLRLLGAPPPPHLENCD